MSVEISRVDRTATGFTVFGTCNAGVAVEVQVDGGVVTTAVKDSPLMWHADVPFPWTAGASVKVKARVPGDMIVTVTVAYDSDPDPAAGASTPVAVSGVVMAKNSPA